MSDSLAAVEPPDVIFRGHSLIAGGSTPDPLLYALSVYVKSILGSAIKTAWNLGVGGCDWEFNNGTTPMLSHRASDGYGHGFGSRRKCIVTMCGRNDITEDLGAGARYTTQQIVDMAVRDQTALKVVPGAKLLFLLHTNGLNAGTSTDYWTDVRAYNAACRTQLAGIVDAFWDGETDPVIGGQNGNVSTNVDGTSTPYYYCITNAGDPQYGRGTHWTPSANSYVATQIVPIIRTLLGLA